MIAEIAGFARTGISGAAYVPQVTHLMRAHCSAGMSELAFVTWLVAGSLIMVQAVATHATVFIALGSIQLIATAMIAFYTQRYKGMACPGHGGVNVAARSLPAVQNPQRAAAMGRPVRFREESNRAAEHDTGRGKSRDHQRLREDVVAERFSSEGEEMTVTSWQAWVLGVLIWAAVIIIDRKLDRL
jgi:hypothetical protein